MKATQITFVIGGLFTYNFISPAYANQSDLCESLLAQGVRDTSNQHITASRFGEIRSRVCSQDYESYGKATAQAMSGGFDLPGLFGISAADSTANSEYSTKWSSFCNANYSELSTNSQIDSYFSTANQAFLHSFDLCISKNSENFIRYVQPEPDGKTFSIVFQDRRFGISNFTINNITLTVNGVKTVPVQQVCDFSEKFPYNTKSLNYFSIVCRKAPEDEVIVNAMTSAGGIDPVTVPSVPSPGPNVTDRITALEGDVYKITKDLDDNIKDINGRIDNVRDSYTRIETSGEYNPGLGKHDTHTFSFSFPVSHAGISPAGNYTNIDSIKITDISGNNVTVHCDFHGSGPNGQGLISYVVWASSK